MLHDACIDHLRSTETFTLSMINPREDGQLVKLDGKLGVFDYAQYIFALPARGPVTLHP